MDDSADGHAAVSDGSIPSLKPSSTHGGPEISAAVVPPSTDLVEPAAVIISSIDDFLTDQRRQALDLPNLRSLPYGTPA